jgi:glutaconate CoA-transferase subunit B
MSATAKALDSAGLSRTGAVAFLIRASAPYRAGGWVFTGFHWPVLAGYLAAMTNSEDLVQVFESGVVCNGPLRSVPTSTTDSFALADGQCVQLSSLDVLHGLMRRLHSVVLDAGNVDVRGRINSTAVGPWRHPSVRLPGGGGAPDAMARARSLILLHGGPDPSRLVPAVEHVTSAPRSDTQVALITRWGTLALGDVPRLETVVDGPGQDAFLTRLDELGVDSAAAQLESAPDELDVASALTVLRSAADRGYLVARRAIREIEE